MTIALVSAAPSAPLQSAPPSSAPLAASFSATNDVAAEGMEGADAALDFTSLLLGQLAAVSASPQNFSLPAALEPVANNGMIRLKEVEVEVEDDAEASDPLALLAMLTQAPVEPRAQLAPRQEAADDGNASEAPIQASVRAAPQEAPSLADRTAASGTAKFAVSPEALSGKDAAPPLESAKPPAVAMTTAIAPEVAANRAASESPRIAVPTSLYDRQWSSDFAQKVTWVATQRGQSAELMLNPPALGNIEVSIKLDNSRSTAVATFVSSSAEVRETIETALPRLREMLAGVGIQLGEAQVSAESYRQANGGQEGQARGEGARSRGDDPMQEGADAPAAAARAGSMSGAEHGLGLVDMFV